MAEHDLKSLYREAQSALKSRDYARASDLLKQILLIDENYKDASRLLAQTVKLRRRRWYNHPLLWGTVAIAALVAIGMLAPRIRGLYARQPSATAITTNSPTFTVAPTAIVTATETPLSAPTPVPLTWKRVSLGQEFERDTVTAFVIDPRDPDVLYAGMKNAGIYKSIDGGLSWHPSHRGISSTQVVSILIDFKAPNIVYAGTKGGIFKTEDGGENWAQIGEGTHVLIDPMDNSHLYTRDADNIYESTDWGKTWEAVYSSQVGCPGKIFAWAIHPTDGSTLFISAGEAECEPGIYQSDDGGRTWTLIQKSEIPPGYEWDWASYLVGEMGWLLVQIEDGNIVIDYGPLSETPPVAGFVYSRCWEPFLPFLCKYSPTGKQPYNLFASGVVRLGKPDVWPHNTEGGTSYELAMTGWTITISPHDPDTIYVAGEGIAVTKDGGLTWTKLNKGLGNTILDLAAGLGNERTLFLLPGKCKGELTNGGHDLTQSLYLSTNGGSAWDFVTETGCYLIMDVNGATMYRISTNYWWTGEALMGWLWRSQDGGRSWRRILIPRAIETIVVHASQTGHLYGFAQAAFYKTNINPDYQEKWYYYSEDFGNTWNEQEPPADAKLCYGSTLQFIDAYRPMTIDPSNGNHVFVIDDGLLLESHDSCDTTEAFAAAPNTSMNSIAFDPNNATTVYAGTDSGAYVSSDGGKTWNEINEGLLGATVIYSIVVDKDSNVYAATPYGIFKLEGK